MSDTVQPVTAVSDPFDREVVWARYVPADNSIALLFNLRLRSPIPDSDLAARGYSRMDEVLQYPPEAGPFVVHRSVFGVLTSMPLYEYQKIMKYKAEIEHLPLPACNHKWVEVGFTQSKIVCYHCNIDKGGSDGQP